VKNSARLIALILLAGGLSPLSLMADPTLEEMLQEDIGEIERLSEGIKPLVTDGTVVVGLGRSPYGIIEYLRISGTRTAVFPWSDIRYAHPNLDIGPGDDHPLSHGERQNIINERVKKLLKTLVPLPKKILLVDYSDSGWSVVTAAEYFREAFKAAGSNIVVESLSFGKEERLQKYKNLAGHHQIYTNPNSALGTRMGPTGYEQYVPYGFTGLRTSDVVIDGQMAAAFEAAIRKAISGHARRVPCNKALGEQPSD
jgi:hypothetical protein